MPSHRRSRIFMSYEQPALVTFVTLGCIPLRLNDTSSWESTSHR